MTKYDSQCHVTCAKGVTIFTFRKTKFNKFQNYIKGTPNKIKPKKRLKDSYSPQFNSEVTNENKRTINLIKIHNI